MCPGLDLCQLLSSGLVGLSIDVDDDGHVVGRALALALVAIDLCAAHTRSERRRAVGTLCIKIPLHYIVFSIYFWKTSFWFY